MNKNETLQYCPNCDGWGCAHTESDAWKVCEQGCEQVHFHYYGEDEEWVCPLSGRNDGFCCDGH